MTSLYGGRGPSDSGRIGLRGRWNNGSNAGVSNLNVNDVLSNRSSNIGSRLTATSSDSRKGPRLSAENLRQTVVARLVGFPNAGPRLDRRGR